MSESQSDSGMCSEIMLFGVRVKVDPIRKCVSMNDLSQYLPLPVPVQVQPAIRDSTSNNNIVDASAAVTADFGYASADDAVRHRSNGGRERKRGVPWTEDEHKQFLLGLEKVGKGDWRGISRKYVTTRTPTQVASHAQKYYLRRSNLNRRRRRSSLFDITTDSVVDIPMEEQQVHEDNNSQPIQQLIKNQMEKTVTFTHPIPLFPTSDLSTRGGYYLDQKQERDSLSLSLSLNLSLSYDRNNGDGIMSVG